jgi:hypothetical protein
MIERRGVTTDRGNQSREIEAANGQCQRVGNELADIRRQIAEIDRKRAPNRYALLIEKQEHPERAKEIDDDRTASANGEGSPQVTAAQPHPAQVPLPPSLSTRARLRALALRALFRGESMEKPYTVFAALSDQTNEGWIWFRNPPLHTRTIVKVRHPETGLVVFCESRKIDSNFLTQYKQQTQREIKKPDETLVISEWYRDALGGFPTTRMSGDQVKLDITPARIPVWRSLRASCHHPDIAVRVGTRLGVLGAWLGLVSLVPALLELSNLNSGCRGSSLIAVAVVGAIFGSLACRGVNRPGTGSE